MSYTISVSITAKPARRSIYIGGISRLATRKDIYNAIESIVGMYGELEDIRIPVNLQTGHPLGYAFAIFKHASDASNFMEYARDGGCSSLRSALDIHHNGVYDPNACVKVSYGKQ